MRSMKKIQINRIGVSGMLSVLIVTGVGCGKVDQASTNVNTNTAVANENTDNANKTVWNSFAIKQLNLSLELPFASDKVNFGEKNCTIETACDYEGYAFFGTYIENNNPYPVGFMGSVSEKWSPSRDANLYEVYDIENNNGVYSILYGNGGKKEMGKPLEAFSINGRSIVIFENDSSPEEKEFVYHNYLGVIKLTNNEKYKAVGISFDKSKISKDDFSRIMQSIQFSNS